MAQDTTLHLPNIPAGREAEYADSFGEKHTQPAAG